MHFPASPDAAIAVLVAGEIFEHRLQLRAVRISGIGLCNIPTNGEMAIRPGTAIPHETVEVRMRGIALELLDLGAARPGCLAQIRAFKLSGGMLRQSVPEACRIRPRRHVVPIYVVRIGDPERRRGVVRRQQNVLCVLTLAVKVRSRRDSERREVGGNARLVRMALG